MNFPCLYFEGNFVRIENYILNSSFLHILEIKCKFTQQNCSKLVIQSYLHLRKREFDEKLKKKLVHCYPTDQSKPVLRFSKCQSEKSDR